MPKGSRGGGPKTPEGKIISSRNSLKTGVYSKQQFLPGEAPEEFDELLTMFIDDLKPSGAIEASLVQEIAVLAWKKLRLERVENQFLYGVLNATPTAEEFFAAGLPRREDIVWLLDNLSMINEQFIKDHQRYLEWAEHAKDAQLTQSDIDQLKERDVGLYDHLKNMASSGGPNSGALQVVLVRWQGEENHEPELSVRKVQDALTDVIEKSKSVLYLAKHIDKIEECKRLIRDRRLKNFMESPGPIRAYQELSRAFFRVLAELRKQQEWRLRNNALET